jgi:alpha-L-fucosidase
MRHLTPLLLFISAATAACTIVLHPSRAEPVVELPYTPAPENLEAREWFRDAGFGIFIHWGVYSVKGQGEWVMNNAKMTVDEYEPLAEQFNPIKFDAKEWVDLFKRSGAKYITITSKHHDGFAMWDSKVSDYDIVDRTPYKQDVLKALAEECKQQDIKLCVYHSHLDWRHPDYFPRGRTGLHSGRPESGDFNRYLDYMDAQLTELLSGHYGPVGAIWFDGWWDQQSKQLGHGDADPQQTQVDWRLRQTYDLIHQLQPACLVGNNHHVTPFAGEDFQMFERDLPGENKVGYSSDASVSELPLETCDTINGNWGYNAGDQNFKSVKQLVHYLVNAAGRNANLLLNVGPLPDGTIDPRSAERLLGMGEWLETYETTVRGTRGGPLAPQEWGITTQREGVIYLHLLNPPAPADGWITLPGTEELPAGELKRFGSEEFVPSRRTAGGGLAIQIAEFDEIDTVLVLSPEDEL